MLISSANRTKSRVLPRYRPLLEMLEDRVVLANDFYQVPGVPGETVRLQFKMNGKAAGANNELSIYLVDDAQGSVNGLLPSQVGYATAATLRAQKLFSATATVGTPRELSLPAGQSYGFLLVRRGSLAQWNQSNPDNNLQQSPLVLFSVDAANPLSRDAVQTKPLSGDAFQVRWEDATSSSVRRLFNDNSITIKPVRDSILKMPGQAGQTVTTTFTVTARNAAFRNELGYFLVDDAIGTIDGVRPGQAGYAQKALSSATRQVIFGNRQPVGSVSTITLPSGSNVMFYIIQNSTSADMLQRNPNNLKSKSPLAFFSLPTANPDRYGHQQWQGFNRFGFEDLYNGGDKDFDDIVVRFTMSAPQGGVEINPPVINAGLRLDTASGGTTNTDAISSIVDVQGTIVDQSQITTFQAALDQSNQFTSVLSTLSANGSFLIDRNKLNQLAGGTLAEGAHTLKLQAIDQHGNNSSVFNLPFILDSQIALNVNLDPASDTGPVGDLITSLGTIALTGLTDPGATVQLVGSSITTTANNQGQYTLPGISLTLGANPLQVKAIDVAGNERVASITIIYEQNTDVYVFDDNLTGWRVDELGGTPTGKGFATASNGSATIHEGDSYLITLSREFAVLSTGPTRMDIEFTSPQFDTTAINSLRDAFEVAFLDSNGQTRVLPFALTRDAWYNATEGQGDQIAPGASASTGTISINLAGLPAGSTGRLFFRLFNNDGDTHSQVTLHRVSLVSDSSLTPPSGSPSASLISTTTPLTIDPATLTNVSGSLVGQYGRSSYFAGNTVLYTTLALRNVGSYGIGGSAIVVIDNLSDPTVVPQGVDGFLPDGRAYFNFSGFLNNGKLAPGATTGVRALQFFTPSGKPFTYNLTVLALPNLAPNFTSEALPDVAPGRTYVYDSEAVDPDGDVLSYQVLTGPTGLSINQNTGLVTWTPTVQQVGNHDIILQASDGRGGNTTQQFTISVRTNIPNRPPIITSTPVVDAYVNRSGDPAGREYNYDVEGFDPDFDPVSYRLAQSPEGMTIDPVTGLIQWRPTANATSTVPVYHRVDLSSFYNNRLQTFSFGSAFNFPVGDQVLGGVPFNIPASGNNTWIAGSPASIEVPVNVFGVTEVDTLINTIWGEFDPATFASVEFYGSNGAYYRYDLDGNRDVRDYVQNVFTNTITGPIASNVFKTGSGFLNEVRLDMQKFMLPAAFANQTLTHVKFTDTGHDFFQRIVLSGMAVVASVPLMGDHPITVVAEDGHGGSAEQSFTITVRNPPENNEPLFVSVPPNLTAPQPSQTIFVDTFNNEPVAPGVFSYTGFAKWDVTAGAVDIVDVNTPSGALSFPPILDGWAVDLISFGSQGLGRIQTKNTINLEPGTYDLTFTLGGSHRSFSPSDSARISLGSAFTEDFTLGFDSPMTKYTRTVTISQPISARFVVEATSNAGNDNAGILIDDISMVKRAVPPKSGIVIGQTYTYDSLAIDPDDDELQYSIVSGPAGLIVNPETGVVTWNTTGFPEGEYEVFLKAADGHGGETVQNFAIQLFNQGGTIRGRKFDTTSQTMYTNNFETIGQMPEWSVGTRSITPSGRSFLGEFGDETVSLTLPSQTAGTSVTVSFDVFIIRTWDGNNTTFGPDTWQLAVQGGPTLTRTTFSNHNDPQFGSLFDQSYPAAFTNPVTNNPAKSGAIERDTLGYGTGFQGDSVYHLTYTFAHPGGPLVLNFTGDTDSPVGNESWGLDNVIVSTSPNTGLAGFIVYLDQNNSAVREPGESYQITDSQGNYEFTNLPAGQYVVREEVNPVGQTGLWEQTFPVENTTGQSPANYVDWIEANVPGGTASGIITLPDGSIVGLDFAAINPDGTPGNLFSAQTNGTGTNYWIPSEPYISPEVPNAPPGTDILALQGGVNQTYRISFTEPIVDPVMSILSLGKPNFPIDYDFDAPFTILSQGAGWWGGGENDLVQLPGNILRGTEGHGTIQFIGTFSSFSWTVPTFEQWHGFTFAIRTVERLASDGFYNVDLSAGEIEPNKDFGNRRKADAGPSFTTEPVRTATVNDLYRYNVEGVGSGGVTYDLPQKPVGMAIDPNTGLIVWRPQDVQEGFQTVVVRVRDGQGRVAIQSYTIEVQQGNTAPAFTTEPTRQAVVGRPWQYRASGIDAENDALTFSLDSGPAGLTITPQGIVNWTPAGNQLGSQTVQIKVSDGRGGEAIQLFTLNVVTSAPNTNPVITGTPRTSVRVGDQYLAQLSASDADGDPLTYSLPTSPSGMTIDSDGRLHFSPTAAQLGAHQVTVRVVDGQGGSAETTFTLNVVGQETNSNPEITSTPPSAATLGRTLRYTPTFSDADGDPVVWSLLSGPVGMAIDPETGIIRWRPTQSQLGPQTVVLQATDPMLASTTQDFTITVRGSNTPPAILSSPITEAAVSQSYEYRVRAQDAEGDVLTYALPIAPTGMVIDSATGIITWNPGVAQVGSFSVQVSASDGQGGVATQDYTIVVSGTALNRPPIITSPPILKVSINRVYSYQIVASDPEGDALVYALLSGPVGMSIDTASGLVNWTPTTAQLGSHLVTVGARDASGVFGQQTYRISVIDNHAPTITSSPVTHGTPGTLYRYDVGASDLDGDTLTYTLTQFQPGMTIDQSGRISWNVPLAQGTVPIGISVTDGRGGIAVQNFNLTIAGDTQAPQVTATINPNPATIGSDILIRVTASDNDRVASLILRINGVVIPLAADGTAHYEALGEGNLPVQVIATDQSGNQGVYTTNIVITDEADPTGQGPAILITSPSDTSNITSLANIVGSINSADGVSNWSVHIAPYGSSSFRQIASGTGAVSNGILGTLDPTLLANDQYIIRVIARDSLNRSSRADVTVNIQGELKLGRFRQEFTDLSIPLAGIPIEIRRVYDTLDAGQPGDFGYGWTMAFADPQIRETVSQNAGYGYFGPEAAPFKVGTKVYLTTPDGERVGFTLAMDTIVVPFFGTYYRPRFVGDAGVVEKLDVLTQPDNGLGDLYIKLADGTFSQPFAVFGGRFNPDNYNLTLTNGTIYRYNQQTGLKEVVDPNGNKLTFSPDGVISSLGVSIQFLRDAQGRIAEIIDPSGMSFKYAYDGSGNLSSVMDQIDNKTQFEYSTTHEHYLSKLIDPRGNTVLQMQYDPVTGRATGLVDAQGNSLHSTFNPGENSEAVRDRRGNTTKYFYDERGNVERVIDSEGGVTTNAYDNSNNLISRTDPNNHTTIFTYDAQGNRTSMTDALNGVTTYDYNAQNKVIRVTDPLGRITTSEYSSTGLKIRELDAAGILTTFEYDDQGRLIALTNAACCGGTAILYAYDSALNRVTQVTDTSGHVTQFEYNSYGLPTLTRDEINEVTRYVYSGTGRLLKVIDSNLGITEYTYDANGNLLTTTDPLLQQTRFEYDTSNRIISSTDPSGKTTSYEFDENNNQIETTDRNGRTRRYVYDRNNRMTEEQWLAAGNTVVRTIAYQYDPAGNRVSIVDPDSHYTFTYDSLNRVISEDSLGTPLVPHVIFTMNYDAAGQLLYVQDSQGVQSQFTYDVRGLVTSRTWAGPGIDSVRVNYGYNALRQQTTISRYGDLAATQLISRTQRSYNDDGELTQLTERSAADVIFARYDYSFTSNGQVATTTENGQLTQYTYDSVGQLLSANHVSQTDELYSYDAAGNRISSQRHGSQYNLTTGNRLTTDGAFDYSYDDEGNLIQRTHRSTGESTQFTYDYRNRLTSAERRSAGGQLLEQSLFTYDARNRRIIVQTSAGITHTLYYEDNPWADYSTNGTVQVRYMTGRSADEMIARSKAGSSTQWYLTDRQGSVRDILSHQGIVENHNSFDSFGNLVSQSNAGESDRFLFTGREYDPSTKLYHYRARQYDASTGRFQQEDPLGFRSDDANLYRYVGNDPISGRDPYGLNNFAENGFLRNIQSFIADIIGDAKYAEYSSKINAALKSPNTLCAALGFGTSLAGGFTLEALAQALGIPANATKDPGIAIGLAWLKSTVELLCIARIGHK
jgi:RHS repeat-associated protein